MEFFEVNHAGSEHAVSAKSLPCTSGYCHIGCIAFQYLRKSAGDVPAGTTGAPVSFQFLNISRMEEKEIQEVP
jgi:hypothetical protein